LTAPVAGVQPTLTEVGQVTIGAELASSKLPVSITPLTTLGKPRWSVGGASVLSPASIAGLPQSKAWVKVGPPLSWSGPILRVAALRLNWSLVPAAIRLLVEPKRLKPPESISLPATQ